MGQQGTLFIYIAPQKYWAPESSIYKLTKHSILARPESNIHHHYIGVIRKLGIRQYAIESNHVQAAAAVAAAVIIVIGIEVFNDGPFKIRSPKWISSDHIDDKGEILTLRKLYLIVNPVRYYLAQETALLYYMAA